MVLGGLDDVKELARVPTGLPRDIVLVLRRRGIRGPKGGGCRGAGTRTRHLRKQMRHPGGRRRIEYEYEYEYEYDFGRPNWGTPAC